MAGQPEVPEPEAVPVDPDPEAGDRLREAFEGIADRGRQLVDRLWPPVPVARRLHDAIMTEDDLDRRALLVDALGEIRRLEGRVSDLTWTLWPDRSGG